ncbi:hypothetical protein MKEN_01457600 [Mycena kentingensis (nom. inval.)]|nr:hypothetical protein MKEN_01457600 [Mycena kentingensis (nom. inval.)]
MSFIRRHIFRLPTYRCDFPNCAKKCKTSGGLKRHKNGHISLPTVPAPQPQPEEVPDYVPPAPQPPFRNDFPSPSPSPSPEPHDQHTQRQTVPEARRGTNIVYHPILDGTPCNADGNDLPRGTPPPPLDERAPDDFWPFTGAAQFSIGDFLYKRVQMTGAAIDELALHLAEYYADAEPPFHDHKDLYAHIDAIQQGDIPWQSFSVQYTGPLPEDNVPSWMTDTFQVWFRCPLKIFERQLANPDFVDELDWAPKRVYKDGKRQFTDLFSGDWVWDQADIIAQDPDTHGAMFVPIILGSDKTTTSVGTGHTEFWPLYGGIGNTYSSTRRAHRDGIALLAFLAIPKTTREHANSAAFRKFRRQLFHTSIARVLSSLKPHMTKPRVTRCADRHFRRAIYGIGPDVADYPEQALLTCIVQGHCPICLSPADDLDRQSPPRSCKHTEMLAEVLSMKELWDDWGIVGDVVPFTAEFPRADIHELISMDLLHQVIKGTFKDHIVDWVEAYIRAANEPAVAVKILADIDRRIAVTPPFPGLRRFPVGRGFKQWTGNDSKGLMKVYLPAITGHVPSEMVQAVAALLEFVYLVRRSVVDEDTLRAINDAVDRFHLYRESFRLVRPDGFSLPRQHSMVHYAPGIQKFGAANGLCTSLTESHHITAIKKPYRRSNHNKPLGQMLLTNQRLDKLAAARVDFVARGMLPSAVPLVPQPPPPPPPPRYDADGDDADGYGGVAGPTCLGEVTLAKSCVRKVPRDVHLLSRHVGQPRLHEHIRRFLFAQLNKDRADQYAHVPLTDCPEFAERVFIYNSARAVFYAPSDVCGIGGMRHERIRATRSWYGGPPRYDCALIEHDPEAAGFRGMHAVRVFLFMKFTYRGIQYLCALVHWFSAHGDQPCPDTGMWVVKPDWVRGSDQTEPVLAVVHLDALLRGLHLIGAAGKEFLPEDNKDFSFSDSLDSFKAFYVNKYADHHAHEILF